MAHVGGSRRSVALAMVAAALAIGVPTTARAHIGPHTGDDWPTLVPTTIEPTAGWASFEVRTTNGGRIAVQLHSGQFTSVVSHALALFDDNGTFIQAVSFSAYYGRVYGVRAYSANGPGGPVTIEQNDGEYTSPDWPPGQGGGFTPVVTPPSTDTVTYKILVWVAGKDLKGWSYNVHAQSGELLGFDAGTQSFLYTPNDFTGTLGARAEVASVGGRVSVGLDKAIEVRNQIFGWYIGLGNGNLGNVMSVTTPTRERDCGVFGECDFFRPNELDGPGTYVFHLTGAGAGVGTEAYEPTLMYADARLPA
jgi:hypothetical protein